MREKLVELLMDMPFGNSTEEAEERHARDTADYLIDNDVVPVVRCKACKYYELHKCHNNANGWFSHRMSDDFCSYGERRSE